VARQIERNILPTVPQPLRVHYERKVQPLLRANMESGCSAWTNNACESINHVLKSYTHWKQHMLPDLTQKLRELVESQHAEADRAICRTGNFRLAPSHVGHQITFDAWRAMSSASRLRKCNDCFRLAPESRGGMINVASTDQELTVNFKPSAGKKLNQRKRPRAERSAVSTCRRTAVPE
jgi:hypothetical protein